MTSTVKQRLDDLRQKHIAKYGAKHWERIVQEKKIRADFGTHRGMTEMMMDSLILNVVNVRFDEYIGYEGYDLVFEVIRITENSSTEEELLCSLCQKAPAISTGCRIPVPITLSSNNNRNKHDFIKQTLCSFVYFLCKEHADMSNEEFDDYMRENRIDEYFMEYWRDHQWKRKNA
jgi:hypothetical protein